MTSVGAIEQFELAERALLERFGVASEPRRLVLDDSGLGVRVLESGGGDPVVFVHGGGSFAAEWAPLLAELTDYRCIAVDRPGCGGSDPFDYTGVDLRSHAVAFLDGLLDALSLERAAFVGQSMGALWSLWLALERPERVSSLALLGAPALILGSSAPLPLRLLGVRGLNRLLLRIDRPSVKQSRRILERLFGAKALQRMTPEFVEAVHRAQLVPGAELAFRTLLERVVRAREGGSASARTSSAGSRRGRCSSGAQTMRSPGRSTVAGPLRRYRRRRSRSCPAATGPGGTSRSSAANWFLRSSLDRIGRCRPN